MKPIKTIPIAVAILLVGLGAYGALYYIESHTGLARFVTKSESVMPSPAAPAVNPTTPVGPVAIAEINATSITVKVNDTGGTITYSIGTSTHVYSLALEGKAGKTFNDLVPGSMVTVYPAQGNTNQAAGIALKRDPALVPSAEDVQNSVAGTVSAVTTDTVTVKPQSGAAVVITLTPSTKLYTTVIEGQSGRPLSIGEQVGVTGIQTLDGQKTAKMILIAPKLTN